MSDNMIQLVKVKTEEMFWELLGLESIVYANARLDRFPMHPQSAVADRFLFGNPDEVFRYAHLLELKNEYIGYANAYHIYSGEPKFSLVLLPGYEQFYIEALALLETLTAPENTHIALHINTVDAELCKAVEQLGYQRSMNESRWLAALSLENYLEKNIANSSEFIERFTKENIPIRAQYSALPTGHLVTEKEYENLFNSEYYKTAEEYVIYLNGSHEIAGFLTWWIDETAKTASLEAVATLPEFRRQGIMYRAITDGLNKLKLRGFQYAYVSTGSENPARFLYQKVGFQKLGEVYLFEKEVSHV